MSAIGSFLTIVEMKKVRKRLTEMKNDGVVARAVVRVPLAL